MPDGETDAELSAVIRRFCRTVDDGLNRRHVLVVQQDRDALQGFGLQALELATDVPQHLGVQIFNIRNHFGLKCEILCEEMSVLKRRLEIKN